MVSQLPTAKDFSLPRTLQPSHFTHEASGQTTDLRMDGGDASEILCAHTQDRNTAYQDRLYIWTWAEF